jgi:hypothetical protein
MVSTFDLQVGFVPIQGEGLADTQPGRGEQPEQTPFFSTRVRLFDPYRLGPGHHPWPGRCGSRRLLPAELERRDLPDPPAIGAHLWASQSEV